MAKGFNSRGMGGMGGMNMNMMKQVQKMQQDMLKLQEEPIMLLAVLGKELRRLYTARLAIDYGRDKFWLMERWNMRSDYPARLLLESARRVSTDWAAEAVKRCGELDLRMKSVTGVDGGAELKEFLMELAQGVRR